MRLSQVMFSVSGAFLLVDLRLCADGILAQWHSAGPGGRTPLTHAQTLICLRSEPNDGDFYDPPVARVAARLH